MPGDADTASHWSVLCYVRLSSKSEDMLTYHILSAIRGFDGIPYFVFGQKKNLTVEMEKTEKRRGNEREKKWNGRYGLLSNH